MTSVHLSDAEAISGCPQGLTIRALRGHAIVWFMPYRRTSGAIETPENAQPVSVEAIVIHDNTGHGLDFGVKVGVTRQGGHNFAFQGNELCNVPAPAMILIDTSLSPEIE